MQGQLLLQFVFVSCRSYYTEANKGFQDFCNSCSSSSISLHRMMALKRVRSAFPLFFFKLNQITKRINFVTYILEKINYNNVFYLCINLISSSKAGKNGQ